MAMTGLDLRLSIAENYRLFAERETAGRSPAYETLALGVAQDATVLGFLAGLPEGKRQPNLLFAAARSLLGRYAEIEDLRQLVGRRAGELAEVMLRRRTQTNEPARCATLLPALAGLPGPLALIEVGASAGLCLQLDRYSYDYGAVRLAGPDPGAPVLCCELRGGSTPVRMPEVTWRGGLDLNPLDPADADDCAWLECLVWPEQPERLTRLAAALGVARRHPVEVRRGDLLAGLPALVTGVPVGATVVVFHSAVLAYVDEPERYRFAELVHELGVHWLSNEAPGMVPGLEVPEHRGSPFVLALDGEVVAFTQPHGDWIEWLG